MEKTSQKIYYKKQILNKNSEKKIEILKNTKYKAKYSVLKE